MTLKRYKIDTQFLLKLNRKLYMLYQMVTFWMTLGDSLTLQITPISAFFVAFHIFVVGEHIDF